MIGKLTFVALAAIYSYSGNAAPLATCPAPDGTGTKMFYTDCRNRGCKIESFICKIAANATNFTFTVSSVTLTNPVTNMTEYPINLSLTNKFLVVNMVGNLAGNMTYEQNNASE